MCLFIDFRMLNLIFTKLVMGCTVHLFMHVTSFAYDHKMHCTDYFKWSLNFIFTKFVIWCTLQFFVLVTSFAYVDALARDVEFIQHGKPVSLKMGILRFIRMSRWHAQIIQLDDDDCSMRTKCVMSCTYQKRPDFSNLEIFLSYLHILWETLQQKDDSSDIFVPEFWYLPCIHTYVHICIPTNAKEQIFMYFIKKQKNRKMVEKYFVMQFLKNSKFCISINTRFGLCMDESLNTCKISIYFYLIVKSAVFPSSGPFPSGEGRSRTQLLAALH